MSGRLEAVRIVADWLIKDLNARIDAVPLDGGDVAPPRIGTFSSDKYPGTTIAVFDENRHPWVLERKPPPALPALYVTSQGILSMAGEATPDGQIRSTKAPLQVAIRYLTAQADTALAVTNGLYTSRAIARSLRELSKNANTDTYRVRNGIYVVLGQDTLDFYPIIQDIGTARIAGAVLVRYLVRDQNPSY